MNPKEKKRFENLPCSTITGVGSCRQDSLSFVAVGMCDDPRWAELNSPLLKRKPNQSVINDC